MRYLVLSDIHGGSEELTQALSFFESFKCDAIVLLGDLLNHGPRNCVPKSYAPPHVADLLNTHKEHIIAVRGNCDSEVDSMVFSFPCNAPYGWLYCETKQGLCRIFLTHGHLHKIETCEDLSLLGLTPHDLVLSGHTHVSGIFEHKSGIKSLNPGSTTIPKGGTENGFALIDEEGVKLFNLEGKLLNKLDFSSLF